MTLQDRTTVPKPPDRRVSGYKCDRDYPHPPMTDRISKVTVEYHDPSGVFPLISQQLQSRLPLRNLHWKSGSRPLRSIDFLHVELVQSRELAPSRPQSQQGPHRSDQPSPAGQAGLVKERRHQIPGLRQTPYLKLYLLRCDDVETYRDTCRKHLREWLKDHMPPSQKSSSNAQENHDAFDWLILHVVIPNTAAANQPRYSGSDSKSEGASSEKSGGASRLKLGRSSNTILEKIKADFNVSSKSAPDRVAQIRLQPDDVPQHLLPQKASGASGYSETPQDRLNAWNDLVAKLRTLILSSFDLRVRQYEDDIRERGAQRALPGWNFCTFFVLKEGLARGFESVGLLDDALLDYDELSAELDSVVQEQGSSAGLLQSASDSKELLERCSGSEFLEHPFWGPNNQPISPDGKAYRDLILANNISVFDFKCYVFARQKDILLRMGKLHHSEVTSSRQDVSATRPQADQENMPPLSELCRRTTTFITLVSRIFRQELRHAAAAQSLTDPGSTIEHIIASWMYAVASQVIEETEASILTSRIVALNASLESSTSGAKAFGHPPRSSSLGSRSAVDAHMTQKDIEPHDFIDSLLQGNPHVSSLSVAASGFLQELAGHRAELYLFQRQILDRIAADRHWPVGWSLLERTADRQDGLQDVDLTSGTATTQEESTIQDAGGSENRPATLVGLCVSPLIDGMESIEKCRAVFQDLTTQAISHYLASKSVKAVERLIADLALLRFQGGDFTGAATLFNRVTPSYADGNWDTIETQLLMMHAECLKRIHRRDEYVRMVLTLLTKYIARRRLASELRLGPSRLKDLTLDDSKFDEDRWLKELLEQSEHLPYELTVPMSNFFGDITIEPHIRHLTNSDGFQVRLKFRHFLKAPICLTKTRLLLRRATLGPAQEFWLESDELLKAKSGSAGITLSSHVNTYGIFNVEKASLTAGKICFVHEDFTAVTKIGSRVPDASRPRTKFSILCYPRSAAFNATVSHIRSVHIDKTRSFEVECSSGLNEVTGAQIHLKSASAGLRIRTADTTLINGDTKIKTRATPGTIEMSELPRSSFARLRIPYGLDGDLNEIHIRLDITYRTPNGDFQFLSIATVPVALAIDVNVHDFFKSTALFSKFSLKTSMNVPLEVLEVQLSGTDAFEVEAPTCNMMPMMILPQQPAPMLYKIKQIRATDGSRPYRKPANKELPLTLDVRYRCLREMVLHQVRTRFRDGLTNNDLAPLSRLLELELNSRLRSALSATDYAEHALMHELAMPSFAALDWPSLLAHLPQAAGEKASAWLRAWHGQNATIELAPAPADDPLTHCLTITVPVPRLQLLHTVSLALADRAPVLATGSPLVAALTAAHTRRWDCPDALKALVRESGALDFVLEIDAPPDAWLIGGPRRIRFSAREDEVVRWEVMLIPLKTGRLPLPSVEVRVAAREAEEVSCVTDYKNAGESVLVINDVGSATVSLREGLHGTEASVVAIEGRK